MTDHHTNDDLVQRGAENSTEGKTDSLKGRVKDGIGGLTNDNSLQAEGKIDKVKGKAKDAIGDIQRDAGRDRDAR
jgi:uncharacterized protein YjbJ (UPF0337 family)